MKEQTLYLCEFCGTQFKDKEKALECESFHHRAKEIVGTSYHKATSIRDGFPDVLMIAFDDGSIERYKRG